MNSEGYREIIGVAEGAKEDKAGWSSFLKHLKEREFRGVQLIISDKCMGLVESIAEFYPQARWQRCVVHFYRNVFSVVPTGKVREVAAMLKAIHAQENREQALAKATYFEEKLAEIKLSKAARILKDGIAETLECMYFPDEHWRHIRTNNPLERIMHEIRRRTRAVGSFPDGNSALMLVAARLRHISGTSWATRRYLNTDLLRDYKREEVASKKAMPVEDHLEKCERVWTLPGFSRRSVS